MTIGTAKGTLAIIVAVAGLVSACGRLDDGGPREPALTASPTTAVLRPSAATTTTTPLPTTTAAPIPAAAPSPPTHVETPSPPTDIAPPPPRFLALGDSYTIGESVKRDERWPAQLVELLREMGVAVADPRYLAETGWRTRELAAALAEASLDPPYGLVTVQIGVNNQFTNGDLEVFRTELAGILDSALALAGGDPGRVLVLSIPDWGVTPFAPSLLQGRIAYEVARFNDVVREEVEARSLSLIDVTASSKRAKEDPSLLSFDDLHPSGLMYAEWAELALDAAAEALRSAPSP